MSEDIDSLKKLSPEARLKKLKEYSEKREKEMKEAQDLMKKSEDEIDKMKKFEEQIPIPQLITDEGETLTTTEEREMFKVHRLKGEQRKQEEKKAKKEETLEETIEQEPAKITAVAQYAEAIQEASMRPIQELYSEMSAIYERAREQGYITREDMGRVGIVYAAVGQKEESGYTAPEREKEALTERICRLQGLYKQQAKDTERQRHGYSFQTED